MAFNFDMLVSFKHPLQLAALKNIGRISYWLNLFFTKPTKPKP